MMTEECLYLEYEKNCRPTAEIAAKYHVSVGQVNCYGIDKRKPRFGLQVFGDMDAERTRRFWVRFLGVPASAFYKTVVTPHRGAGTYKRKTEYGVMTVYFNNTRLRDILVDTIARLSDGKADVAQLVEHVLGGSQSSAHPRRRR